MSHIWGDFRLHLYTPEELKALNDGETLISIDGKATIKTPEFDDFDTRGGVTAYGYLTPID